MAEQGVVEQDGIPPAPVPDKTTLATPAERKKLGEVVTWDIMRLTPNPLNPRGSVDPADASIVELAESVKAHGLIQPILATPTGTIVAGHRRYYACLTAGVQLVRVLVRELSEREQLELMLVENVQRRDLNPVQIARGYKALQERGLSIEAIAVKVGWAKATVSKHLAILGLPEEVQGMYARSELALGYIPHLLELKDPAAQVQVAVEAAQKGMLVNEVAAAVNRQKPKRRVSVDSVEPSPPPERVTVAVRQLPSVVLEYLEAWAKREGRTLNEHIVRQLIFTCEIDVDCSSSEPEPALTPQEADEWYDRFTPYTVMNEKAKGR